MTRRPTFSSCSWMSSRTAAARRNKNPREYSDARPSTRRGCALTPAGQFRIPSTRTSVGFMDASARRSGAPPGARGGLLTPTFASASRVTQVSLCPNFSKSNCRPSLSLMTKTVSWPLQISKLTTGVSLTGVAPTFGRDARAVHSKTPSKSRLPSNHVRKPRGWETTTCS